MSPRLLIWISVLLSGLAQVFLKQGTNRLASRVGAKPGALAAIVLGALEPWIWIWAGSFCVAAALWLLGVEYLDLSYAFPLLSSGYILVTLLSIIVFKEHVGALRWLAVGIISAGVAMIAVS
jgi:undecaprenyl phosphate-alpha-L-ara4N flippase subunit ArnE